jgi:hypothetical protein
VTYWGITGLGPFLVIGHSILVREPLQCLSAKKQAKAAEQDDRCAYRQMLPCWILQDEVYGQDSRNDGGYYLDAQIPSGTSLARIDPRSHLFAPSVDRAVSNLV